MRSVLALVIALVVLVGGVGCAPTEPDAAGPVIGVALPSHNPRWRADAEVIRRQLEAAGYRADIRFAGGEIPTQVRQIGDLLDEGVSGLIVVVIDVTSLANTLDRAARDGVPVMAYDRLPLDTAAIGGFVTFDHVLSGRQQAWSLLAGLGLTDLDGTPLADPPPGPFTIEVFSGPVEDPTAALLRAGAMEVLQPLLDRGVLVVGSGQTRAELTAIPGWGPDLARDRLVGILDEHYPPGRDLDAVLSPDDRISAGVAEALDESDREGVVVTGRGAGEDAARALLEGRQYSTIFADSRALAVAAVRMTLAAVRGEAPETTAGAERDNGAVEVPTLLVPTVTVVAENLERVLPD